MKKITYADSLYYLQILDSKDYIITKKKYQDINDKYVDEDGDKITAYEGRLIIRKFYDLSFDPYGVGHVSSFRKFKYYKTYDDDEAEIMSKSLNIRNPISYNLQFDDLKSIVLDAFSHEIKINIK